MTHRKSLFFYMASAKRHDDVVLCIISYEGTGMTFLCHKMPFSSNLTDNRQSSTNIIQYPIMFMTYSLYTKNIINFI